jgi:hypothetical protein
MLTDNELILLGIESEMERISQAFRIVMDDCDVSDDNKFQRLTEYRAQFKVLEARHDALTEIEF